MPLKLVVRALVTWAIEAAALALLARVLPGVRLSDWLTGSVAVLIIGALNALVRPVIILFAANLGVVLFTLIALLLNAALVLIASDLLPGFEVEALGSAFLLAFGLAVLNSFLSAMLGINDEDSFYRNAIRWLERRRVSRSDADEAGTIIVQIDGLAESILRSEIQAGGLPTLARWLADGTHRLGQWECDLPSMTSSGQSGILYGNNANIPAFRWYEKESGRLIVSNHPRDARLIDERQETNHGLLREHGSSVGNILSGSAEHCVITMSRLVSSSGQITARTQDLYDYFVNPYNLYRAIASMAWEIVVEVWQAWQQRTRGDQPRMDRGGSYPIVRAVTTVLLRDITTWMLVGDMFAGRRVSYADYLGYDEVAHHSGPATQDARRVLRKIDQQLRQLQSAARTSPRRYRFVVLSDHGQSTGATFRQRYGLTLHELVHRLISSTNEDRTTDSTNVQMASGAGEGVGQLRALFHEFVRAGGAMERVMRTVGPSLVEPPLTEHARVEQADVVVCASGNLAMVYLANEPGRLSLERLNEVHPGLVQGLVEHPGIGFVLVHSQATAGPVVLGAKGRRDLIGDSLAGEDPLAGFSPHTASRLRRLSGYANAGDIVVNSLCEPGTEQVAAFEELIGCHGGAGGPQTSPFVLYPSDWGELPVVVGAEQLHVFLRRHIGRATETAAAD